MPHLPVRRRVLDAARRVAPAGAKRAVRRLGGQPLVEARRRRLHPVLSVVMPVYDVEDYLPDALDSVLGQTLREVEVIAVDDSSTDGCLEILRAYERRDPRVRVLTQPNAGQGAARNRGVDVARGEFLTFVDSDDTVPPDAFRHMVDSLRSSGSDFNVGSVRRLHHGAFQRTAWMRTAHEADHVGVTLEEFPRAMQDVLAHHRVFRTAFWRERIGGFRAGIAYEDHVPMLMAYVRATRFDSLRQVTYDWRIRENLTSTSQAKARLKNLRDRIEVTEEAHVLLLAEASDFVHDVWVGRVLELDLPPFLTHAVGGDEEYRALLAATFRTYLGRATDRALEMVSVRQKVRGRLAAEERWDDLARADTHFEDIGFVPLAKGRDGVVVAVPLPDEPDDPCRGVDAQLLRLAPIESHFQGVVEHLEWSSDRLRVRGWAVRRALAIEDPGQAELVAWLVDDAGTRTELPVHGILVPQANIWGNQQLAAYQGGGFELDVDLELLRPGAGPWHLEVRTTYAGVLSEGRLLERVNESAVLHDPGTRHTWGQVGGTARARMDDARGLCLEVETGAPDRHPPAASVGAVTLLDDELEVVVEGEAPHPVLTLTGPGGDLPFLSRDGARSRFGLRREDGLAAPSGRYELVDGATRMVVSDDYAGRLPDRQHGPMSNLRVGQDDRGRIAVHLEPPLPPEAQGTAPRRRMRDACAHETAPVVDMVLFRQGAGHALSGDLLALDRLAVDHGLRRCWTVADLSVPVPDGVVPLVLDSPEWYAALATSRLVCTDTDFGPFLRRAPGQRRARCFPSFPLTDVGRDAWAREGLSVDQVSRETGRRRREWDVLLVPSEDAVRELRTQVDVVGLRLEVVDHDAALGRILDELLAD